MKETFEMQWFVLVPFMKQKQRSNARKMQRRRNKERKKDDKEGRNKESNNRERERESETGEFQKLGRNKGRHWTISKMPFLGWRTGFSLLETLPPTKN